MKKALVSLIFIILLGKITAQDTLKILDNYNVDTLLLDFAVPDLPAFKALGTDPSDILRPSDVQKFALAFEPFVAGGAGVIPSNFAVDFAPWKMMSGSRWTVEDYRRGGNRFLYNSSFSVGSLRENDESTESKVSVGYRVKLGGRKADLLLNDGIFNLSDKENRLQAKALNLWRTCRNLSARDMTESLQEDFVKEFNENIQLYSFLVSRNVCLKDYQGADSVTFKKAYEKFKASSLFYSESLKDLIKQMNKKNWNASRTDLAFAWVGASSDSLVKNIASDNFLIWITQSLRLGPSGQLLLGGTFQSPKDEDKVLTGNLRTYVGTNDFKGYFEYQIKNKNEVGDPSSLINIGAELRFSKDFWIQFYAGIEDIHADGEGSRFRSSLNLKYSFNQSDK